MSVTEFSVFAQMRSGHHAVINWMRFKLPGLHVFLNAALTGQNPLASCSIIQSRIGLHTRDIRARKTLLYPLIYGKIARSVIYNYEEQLPGNESSHTHFGHGNKLRQIVVLRHPANLLASRWKWELTHSARFEEITKAELSRRLELTIETWAQFAEMYLQPRNTSIYYDRWFSDPHYRVALSAELGLSDAEPSRNEIARWGPGSSFDGVSLSDPSQLKVLARWREYEDEPLFARCLKTPKVKRLLARIDPESEASQWLFSLAG